MPGPQLFAVASARGASLSTVLISVVVSVVAVLVVLAFLMRRGGRR